MIATTTTNILIAITNYCYYSITIIIIIFIIIIVIVIVICMIRMTMRGNRPLSVLTVRAGVPVSWCIPVMSLFLLCFLLFRKAKFIFVSGFA